jgi:hypothetical protein
MAHILYRIVTALVPTVVLFSFSCKPVTEPIVGSPEDTPVPNAVVTIDSTYHYSYSTTLYATGKVKNNGTSTIDPGFWVECQFYTDSSFTLKLGGGNTQITVNLGPGQATFWTISYYSADQHLENYPNFAVKDQRAIRKK